MAQPTILQVDGDNSGAIYTVQLNEILSAHSTMFAGNTEPPIIVANMVWQDTSVDPPRFWRRNATNSAWNLMGQWNNGTYTGNVTGASGSTAKLTTPRAIALSGDATGSVSFDGSANATIPVTLSNSGVAAGTYGSATQVAVPTVDSKGRVTAMTNQTISFPAQAITSWNGRTGAVTLNTTDVFNVLPAKSGNGGEFLKLNLAENALEWSGGGNAEGKWTVLYSTSSPGTSPTFTQNIDLFALGGIGIYRVRQATNGDDPATNTAVNIWVHPDPVGLTPAYLKVGGAPGTFGSASDWTASGVTTGVTVGTNALGFVGFNTLTIEIWKLS